jgi:putative ABC transport system permease protein
MFKNYLKITLRNLVKHKTYSFVNISGLAIAMAASFIIFLYVSFELSYDKFHKNADRIYRLRNDRIYKDIHDKSAGCPPALGPMLKKEFPEILESVRVLNANYMNNIVSYIPGPEPAPGSKRASPSFNQEKIFFAESSFLKIFSFPMMNGSHESALQEPNTAVISQSSARKYFGDEDPMGKIITITNPYGKQHYRITGIFKDVSANSHIKFEFLLSYKSLIQLKKEAEYYWGWNMFNTYILLSPTADPHALAAKLPGFVERHKNHGKDYRRAYILQPLTDIHLHSHLRHEPEVNGNIRVVYFLTFIAVLILIIAWINYINLSMARSMTRAKEVGIRKVLGSRRIQLIKQFMAESGMLNILAFITALAVVQIVLPYFNRFTSKQLIMSFSPRNNAWLWLVLSTCLGAILSAIYPAFILSSFKPVTILRGKFTHSSKGITFRKGLVIFQFAVSIILIVGTLTVYKQLSFMRKQDLGINMKQTLAVRIPGVLANVEEKIKRFKKELSDYPSINAITASSTIPGKEYSNAASGIRPLKSNPEDGKRCFFISVDYDYFDFFGIEVSAGRKFSKAFTADMKSIILNEEAARMFGYENPEKALAQKIILGGLGGQIKETIGVIKNYHHKSLKESLEPIIFTITEGDVNGRNNYFSIRTDTMKIDRSISLVKSKWDEVFPGKPFEYFFLDESFNIQYESDRQFGNVFGMFAVLSIFISSLGLFGLASFTTLQRTKEIGIRKVFGASVQDIIGLFSKEIIILLGIAAVIACPIAYHLMSNWLNNFAFRTSVSIWILLFSGTATFIVALFTTAYHTVRIALSNPVESIRYE